MRRIPLTVIILALAFALPAFTQQRWERTYGGTDDDYGFSVQQTTDGGYVVAGSTGSFGYVRQVYLIKTNALGDTLWTRNYGGASRDEGFSVQQTSDTGYIVAGIYDYIGTDPQFYLIKTNASGDTLWTRTYGGTSTEESYSVRQTLDGGYIVAGWTNSFGNGWQVYLIKTNASGDTLWTRTYGGPDDELGYSVQQTSDTGYIVQGYTWSVGTGEQVYLIKTNASGDTLWTRTYGGTSDDYGFSIQQTSDMGYIFAGQSNSFGNGWQVYLVKTDASGDTLWTRTFGGTGYDEGYSVQQTTDGGYVVAGVTNSFGNGLQVYLIKTDASGNTLWTRTFGGTDADYGTSVRQTLDGGYIIAGYTYSFGAGICDAYLIKTDSLGNSTGVEESKGFEGSRVQGVKATPNPFTSFATVPGHEREAFTLYDVSGRKVGVYKGDRIGEALSPGVYFLKLDGKDQRPLRVVKLR
jgi:hypothetical protein